MGNKVNVIIETIRTHLLKDKLICADETTVQVLREQDRSEQSKSYTWVYRSGEYVEQPIVINDYQPSLTGQCVKDFLGDYSGYLLTDGYQAYNGLENVIQVGCLAHVRRKFTHAQKAQPKKNEVESKKRLTLSPNCMTLSKKRKD